MQKKRLPGYIVELIEALDRDEVFDVDSARLPKGWQCECHPVPGDVLGEPGTLWTVSVRPKNPRRAYRGCGKLILATWRVGPNSYSLLVPKALVPVTPGGSSRVTIEAAYDRAGRFEGIQIEVG